MKDVYGLYYDKKPNYNGIIRKADSQSVCLSSVPNWGIQEAWRISIKMDTRPTVKEYHECWYRAVKKNDARYKNTRSHEKNYAAKNMMHVFGLPDMAIETGKEKKPNMKRPNRDFLLTIKAGKFEYTELLKMADGKQEEMEIAFEESPLPEKPDVDLVSKLTYTLGNRLYQENPRTWKPLPHGNQPS